VRSMYSNFPFHS